MDKDQYRKKLLDPRWQKMRLEILNRDEFNCQQCFDSASTLHVHHRWYEPGKDPWEYNQLALVTLCENCHTEESQTLRDYVSDLTLILKQCGAMSRQFNALCEVFSALVNKPLDEYEWSTLTWSIQRLLSGRFGENEHWTKTKAEEASHYKKIAAQIIERDK